MEEKKLDSMVIKEYFIDITKEGSPDAGKDEFIQDITKDESTNLKKALFQDTSRDDPINVKKDDGSPNQSNIGRIIIKSLALLALIMFFLLGGKQLLYTWYYSITAQLNNTPAVKTTSVPPGQTTNTPSAQTTKVDPTTGLNGSSVDKNKYFTLGSTQEEVRRLMGYPTITNNNTWRYVISDVYFDDDGKVRGWYNSNRSLKVSLGDRVPNAPEVKKGSTRQEVVNREGTPMAITDASTWRYGNVEIYFDQAGRVDQAYDFIKQEYLIR